MNLVELRPNPTPEMLAENFLKFVRGGQVKWAVMVIIEADDSIRFEYTRLPSNIAAIGAVEMLKQHIMEQ